MILKILLVRPPEFRETAFAQMYPVYESLGLGYVAAGLRKNGYDVEILDSRIEELTAEGTAIEILKSDAALIGFTMPSGILFPQVAEIIKSVRGKNKKIHITIGGQYPTFAYNYILSHLPQVDTVVRFEGDETLSDLIKSIDEPQRWPEIPGLSLRKNGTIITTPGRRLIGDLDSLPFPARDTLTEVIRKSGVAIVSTSRGCYAGCKFCSVRSFYRPTEGALWRGRSPANILKEIEQIKYQFNPHELWFGDDNFFGPGDQGAERVRKIFGLMKEKGISFDAIDFSCRVNDVIKNKDIFSFAKELGLRTVYLGVESGVQRILDIYQKRTTVEQNMTAVEILKDFGLDVKMEFIFFNPWINYEEVKENIAFLQRTGIYDPYILSSTLTIHTYAPIWKDIESGALSIEAGECIDADDYDSDSYRPYKFSDKMVSNLYEIINGSFQQFEPVFYELWNMDNELKKLRREGKADAEMLQSLFESYSYLKNIANEVGMDLFMDAMQYIESGPGDTDEQKKEKINEFTKKINNLYVVVANVVRERMGAIDNQ